VQVEHERPDWDRDLGSSNNNPPDRSLLELLREDLATHERDWLCQGFWALAVHRFGNWRMGLRWKICRAPCTCLYRLLYRAVEWCCGISLPYTTRLGRRVHLWHHGGMILMPVSIGNDVQLRQNTTIGVAHRGDGRWLKPVIEDRVDIGAGAVIVGDICIGHDSIVGANAVVLQNVPPWSLAVGVPAVVKPRRDAPAEFPAVRAAES
jgi:serine O-acetyltransferase